MYKFLNFICFFIFLATLTGCKDNVFLEEPGPELQTIHFHLHLEGMECQAGTRAYSDGELISTIKCYVYNQSNGASAAPYLIQDIPIKAVNGHPGGEISLFLPRTDKYDIVFLATCGAHDNQSSAKIYYNQTARTIKINYNLAHGNDDELDCFFATLKNVSTESVENTIQLKRPLAQINIGTQDYATYNSAKAIKNFQVSVEGIYDTFSVMDGTISGNPQNITFAESTAPVGQTFPINGYDYIAMNYVLVDSRKLVNVSLNINHTKSTIPTKTIQMNKIAVERNYQTNIYSSNLLSDDF